MSPELVGRVSLAPLRNEMVSEQAYATLRTALLRGEFVGGQQLDIGDIGRSLGVSATPLKEALRRLSNEGLIEIRPRLGTYVAPVTERRLLEVAEARLAIERWGLDRFAQAATESDYSKLNQLMSESEALASEIDQEGVILEDRFAVLDHEFHRSILVVAGNAEMVRFFELLGSHVLLARAWCLDDDHSLRARVHAGIGEHQGIMSALRSGDVELARTRLHEHIMQSTDGARQVVHAHGGLI